MKEDAQLPSYLLWLLGAIAIVCVVLLTVTGASNRDRASHINRVGILVKGAPGEYEWNDLRVHEIAAAAQSLDLPVETSYVKSKEREAIQQS